MRVAIIGSDVSAVAVSWMLRNHAEVLIIESGNELSGHSYKRIGLRPNSLNRDLGE